MQGIIEGKGLKQRGTGDEVIKGHIWCLRIIWKSAIYISNENPPLKYLDLRVWAASAYSHQDCLFGTKRTHYKILSYCFCY